MSENNIAIKEPEAVEEKERMTKYITHVKPRLKEILEWLKMGMNEYSIAEKLDVSQNSLTRYKTEYLEFGELYARAQDERNCLVMNSMFRKANGEKVKTLKQKLDKFGEVHNIIEEVYVPADVNAADLYLRNNDPNYKSAKTDLSAGNITINNYSMAEIEAKRNQILSEIQKLEAIEMQPVKSE